MPEECHHEHNNGEEVGHVEELITKVSVCQVSPTFSTDMASVIAHRMVLWDAKVNHAWKIIATMPVQ